MLVALSAAVSAACDTALKRLAADEGAPNRPIASATIKEEIDAVDVSPWIEQLRSESARARSEAEQRLLQHPAEALAALPDDEDATADAALKDAVRRLRGQLERAVARQQLVASRVTLQGTWPLAKVLEEISQQTGNRCELSAGSAGRLSALAGASCTIDWKGDPFWQAIEDVAATHRLAILSKDGQIVLAADTVDNEMSTDEPRAPTKRLGSALSGPFRLSLLAVEPAGAVTAGPRGERSVSRLRLGWQAEPRLRGLFLQVNAADWDLALAPDVPPTDRPETLADGPQAGSKEVLEGGRATTKLSSTDELLTPFSPRARYDIAVDQATQTADWTLEFVGPPNGISQRSWALSGQAEVTLALAPKELRFDHLARQRGTVRRAGGLTIRMETEEWVSTEQGHWSGSIELDVSYERGGPAFESYRNWLLHNRAWLIDEIGGRHDFCQVETTQTSESAVRMRYVFAEVQGRTEEAVFVYASPAYIVTVPVRWKDLTGPQGTDGPTTTGQP